MNKFDLRVILYLILLLFLWNIYGVIFAQNDNNKSQKTNSNNTATDDSDPTMIRAKKFIGQKLPPACLKYQQMRDTFIKKCSREDSILFRDWEYYYRTPIRIETWKREWNEYPESHVPFGIIIRSEIKGNKYFQIGKLNPKLDDETLFRNYIDLSASFVQKAKKYAELAEQKLKIPEELKNAVKNPESHEFIISIYHNYLDVQTVKKLNAQREAEEAAAAEARRKIVPVERTSKKYKDAFAAYRQAVEFEKQAIAKAEQNDLTWKRAKYLIEIKELGSVSNTNTNNLMNEFVNGFDETKLKKFQQWQNGFEILTSINTTENEWQKEPTSHPAILFCTNIFLLRTQQKENNESFNSDKINTDELLKGDKKTVEKYNSILKQKRDVDDTKVALLEKELRIPAKLKNAIKDNVADSTLFLIYDTYFREFTPDEVKKSKQNLSKTIDELNLLRPNWAAEEGIEFPDRASQILHQNKIDKEPK
ncbi:MAG: hypothetical protein LBP59_00365 [Planctomycetaceae bacterium]|jgi:hypothetical protein|nr:hypothetical protein [Planctomycetaceae bacterium]